MTTFFTILFATIDPIEMPWPPVQVVFSIVMPSPSFMATQSCGRAERASSASARPARLAELADEQEESDDEEERAHVLVVDRRVRDGEVLRARYVERICVVPLGGAGTHVDDDAAGRRDEEVSM